MRSLNRAARGAGMALAGMLFFGSVVDVAAQEMDPAQAYLIDAFERAKAWDISLAEAMPDSAVDWAPSADVRGFGAQIVHTANNGFVSQALFGKDAPPFGVDEASVSDKGELIAAVTNAYDFIIANLREMDPGALGESVDFFGRSMARARVAMFALEHAMWTRGQLVPYLHAHGVAVPAQRLF
jgi:hypothetical protein